MIVYKGLPIVLRKLIRDAHIIAYIVSGETNPGQKTSEAKKDHCSSGKTQSHSHADMLKMYRYNLKQSLIYL